MRKNNEDLSNADYISADKLNVPEISLKAIILATIITIMLTASTIFLGLKVGITISASIPAAVISMGILGLFRRHNILENNIVQTCASSGMSLASGIIFCLPALLIMRVWQHFHFIETMLITLYGGILGVLFSVPFRKLLLSDKTLHYPEGTAIGYVLKAKGQGLRGLKLIIYGGVVGAVMSFAQTGLKIITETVDLWFRFGKTIGGISIGFSPVLIGAGYIIGGATGFTILLGIIIGWVIGLPWLGIIYGLPASDDLFSTAMFLWSKYARYIGVGVLLVGSLYVFFKLVQIMLEKYNSRILKKSKSNLVLGQHKRTEHDLPKSLIIFGSLFFIIPIYIAYQHSISANAFNLPALSFFGFNSILVIFTMIASLIFSVVCGYIVGMVGSSASPISAMAISAIVMVCLLILAMLGGHAAFYYNPEKAQAAATLSIMVGLIVTCSAAIMNDTIQDLKVGDMIGATPWKLELMQIIGVVIAALISPLVLELLYQAYGLGGVYPREGMDPAASLAAPQAQLMASLSTAIFQHNLPWRLIAIGAAIAVVVIFIDEFLKRKKLGSLSVIAVGIGIYVPIFATSALVLGGIISYLAERKLRQRTAKAVDPQKLAEKKQHNGFLLASGLIAGGAIMGIILAIPFVIMKSTDALAIVDQNFAIYAMSLGIFAAAAILYWIYRITLK